MNDKLKELMLEAGYAAPEIATRAHVLAELIIQECIKQNKSYMTNSTHRDFYLGWNDAITHCNESAKEHFGVAE
jgi:hypothetical protein